MTDSAKLMVSLTVKNAPEALNYYQRAFQAEVIFRMDDPSGDIAHATLKVGNTLFYLSGEFDLFQAKGQDTMGVPSSMLLSLSSEDPDKDFAHALSCGGTPILPVQDFPWGARSGLLLDPFGYRWIIGKEEAFTGEPPSPEEMAQMMAGWTPVLP